MSNLECVGQFGEYEVWQTQEESGPAWHITDGEGEFIYPGDDDLLKALTLIAELRKQPMADPSGPWSGVCPECGTVHEFTGPRGPLSGRRQDAGGARCRTVWTTTDAESELVPYCWGCWVAIGAPTTL